MIKTILILVAAIFSFSAQAQVEENEINVVISSPKEVSVASKEKLPECNNALMLELVSAKIQEYQKANPSNSIVGRREQALIIKNLKNFIEEPVLGFNHDNNYNVAKELVMAKVNYHLNDNNIRLCRNIGNDIYLLIYPDEDRIKVQIINFAPSNTEFSVYMEQKS